MDATCGRGDPIARCGRQRSSDEPNLDPPVLLPPLRIVRTVRPRVRRDRLHLAPALGLDRRGCHDVPIDEPALDRVRTMVRQYEIVTCVADGIGVALDGERARRSLPD